MKVQRDKRQNSGNPHKARGAGGQDRFKGKPRNSRFFQDKKHGATPDGQPKESFGVRKQNRGDPHKARGTGGQDRFKGKPRNSRFFQDKKHGATPDGQPEGGFGARKHFFGNKNRNTGSRGNHSLNSAPQRNGNSVGRKNFGNRNPSSGKVNHQNNTDNSPHKNQNLKNDRNQGKWRNRNRGNASQQNKNCAENLDSLFTSKPSKVDYCLAPERLEAQQRAIKRFEVQEREEAVEDKRKERERRHKLMTMKTKKGQPVMQGRMELLYEKVQEIVGKDKG